MEMTDGENVERIIVSMDFWPWFKAQSYDSLQILLERPNFYVFSNPSFATYFTLAILLLNPSFL